MPSRGMADINSHDALETPTHLLLRCCEPTNTRTPVLVSDGADLAAALQTLREIGDEAALAAAVEDAFPGSEVEVTIQDNLFDVAMRQHGLLRPLRAAELSDGTLRYLLLVTRLADTEAADQAQIIVVSHASTLVEALGQDERSAVFELRKELGETIVDAPEPPPWSWPRR